jgi:hypothetical protein
VIISHIRAICLRLSPLRSGCGRSASFLGLSVDLVLRFIRLPWESFQQAVKNWLFPRFHMLAM